MRYKLSLLSVVLLLSLKVQSQNTVALIDDVVANIKSDLVSSRKVEKVNSETGYRFLYYQNEKPVAIEVRENGRIEKKVMWYFYNSKLIYTETIWTDTITARKVHQEKTYHYEEAMIAWLDGENSFVEASTSAFSDLDKALRAYGRKIYQEATEE